MKTSVGGKVNTYSGPVDTDFGGEVTTYDGVVNISESERLCWPGEHLLARLTFWPGERSCWWESEHLPWPGEHSFRWEGEHLKWSIVQI